MLDKTYRPEAVETRQYEAWEQAVQGYKDHLRQIRDDLPAGLRQLVESVYLHDARVLNMWPGRRSR